jgi:hypothetical protein
MSTVAFGIALDRVSVPLAAFGATIGDRSDNVIYTCICESSLK